MIINFPVQLRRPLIVIDVEATGLHVSKDKIIELALVKIDTDQSSESRVWRFNPGSQLTEEIIALTGITNADLQGQPGFGEKAKEIQEFIGDADFAGFNLMKLDLPLLVEEFLRLGLAFEIEGRSILDAQRIFHQMEKRNLQAAYRLYCGKELNEAHSALADAGASLDVLIAQLHKYPELGSDVQSISAQVGNMAGDAIDLVGRFIKNESGEVIINFGKYKGQRLDEVLKKDSGYYGWMMKGDFTLLTKKRLTEIKTGQKR